MSGDKVGTMCPVDVVTVTDEMSATVVADTLGCG